MKGKKERQVEKKVKMCMGNLSQKIYCEMFFQKTMFGVVEKNS
jgi:hypothetical protein